MTNQNIKNTSECITTNEVNVTRCTTKELAKLILETPETIFSFATTLKDMYRHTELGIDQPVDPWPWYGIVCTKMFDVYSVFINRLTIIGGAPFMFDLPDYDNNIEEEQSEECLQDMINGLTHFNELYGTEPDAWYFKESEQDSITILFNGME